MRRSAKKRSYLLPVVIVLVCAAIAAVSYRHLGSLPSSGQASQPTFWEGQIRAVGASSAYRELGEALKGTDPSTQHGDAHAFGDALYAVSGVGGISTCDAQFSYGCYHEFIGKAIVDKGLPVIAQLDTTCAGDPGCQHGIGHGLLAYLGYSLQDLQHALSVCNSLPDDNHVQGCDAGAYMEYNLRSLLEGSSTAPVRLPDANGLFSPCNRLSEAEALSCYIWQPQWWWVYYTEGRQENGTEAFAKTVALCEQLSGALRTLCAEGAGLMAPPASGYKAGNIPQLCQVFSTKTDQVVCRAYAGTVFLTTGLAADAPAVCTGLSGDALLYCQAYADGSASLVHPYRPPTTL